MQALPKNNSCLNCLHNTPCGYFENYRDYDTDEENFADNCVGCCCGDGAECNKESGLGYGCCSNWEHEDTPLNMCMG